MRRCHCPCSEAALIWIFATLVIMGFLAVIIVPAAVLCHDKEYVKAQKITIIITNTGPGTDIVTTTTTTTNAAAVTSFDVPEFSLE